MTKAHNTLSDDQLVAARRVLSLTDAAIRTQVHIALEEDVGDGDITAALLDEHEIASASIICRENATLCGAPWLETVFQALSPEMKLHWFFSDGETMQASDRVCQISGPVRSLLTGERTALNFLQTLSGTATLTRRYVDAIAGTGAQILDTRKTLPGLRLAQKYAVVCGGGHNHRLGLYDMVLIKENHIAAAGSIAAAMQAAHALSGDPGIEVEVENLPQLEQALTAGAKRILLDNMDPGALREAVNRTAGTAQLEASGNVTLGNIKEIAETGVDYISVGSLTKHLQAIDFSLRID